MSRAVLVLSIALLVTACGGAKQGRSVVQSGPTVQTAQDVEVNRNFRRNVLEDKMLSENAYNIHVQSSAGIVVLQGAVANARERERVLQIANQVPGVENVKDRLEVLSQAVASKEAEPTR